MQIDQAVAAVKALHHAFQAEAPEFRITFDWAPYSFGDLYAK